MTCTMYFYAEDQDGNALPFDAYFVLMKWDRLQWVVEGTYTIPRGGFYRKIGLLDYPQTYQARPLLDVRYEDDWERPRDKDFTCRSPDITFVYEAIEPEPTIGALQVSSTPSDGWIYIGRTESDLLYFGRTTHALVREPGTWYVQVRNVSGYQDSEIRAVTVKSGETTYEHFDLIVVPEVQLGHVNVTTKDAWTDTPITGANVYIGVDRKYTGKTTPCTLDLEPSGILGYEFIATKDHFTTPPRNHVVRAGETSHLEIPMQALGLQCNISLGSIAAPDVFPPPPLPTGLPSLLFDFNIPFTVGEFTYSGIGWLASLHTPAPHTVTNALVKSLVVKVNGTAVSPIYMPDTGSISFDLFTILQGMDPSSVTDLKIEITYATRLWFDTFDFSNNKALETATKTIIIPVARGFCSLIPSMTGPAEIPITLPVIPSIPPIIGNSVLDIILGVECENLAPPSAVPIKLFLFGSNIPSLDTSVSPTSYTPDLSSYILPFITAMISSGTPIPDTIEVLLMCPEKYSESGFSTTMTETRIVIPLSAPLPGKIVCGVGITPVQPAGIVVSQPDFGVPGLNIATLPITGVMGIVCKENGAPIPIPSWIWPPDIDLYVMGEFVTTLSVDSAGNFTRDIISLIDAATLITHNTTNISVELWYPSVVWIEGVTNVEDVTLIKKSISIPVTLPELPGPIICLPSIPADDFKYPPSIQLSPVEVLDPVTFDASISCNQDGKPVTPPFSFDAEFFIGEYKAADITVYAGSNTVTAAQLTGYIIAAMAAGKITLDMLSFQIILEYPTKITDGIPGDYVEIKKTIDITPPWVPGPVICLPSIPAGTVTHPPNIQLSPPLIEGGLPTLDPVSDPVTFDASMSCSQDGVDAGVTFPFYAEFYVVSTDEEDKAADISVYSGANTIPIAALTAYINAAIARGDITIATTSFNIYLVYPTRIEDGVPGDYTTIAKTIDITPPGVPPEPIVCNITNVTEKEPLIVTISELGIPTVDPCDIDVQLYITPPCGKSMADILTVTGSYLSLNHTDGTPFASIPLNIYGEGVLNIASYARNWLLTITEIPTSLDLVLVCPSKVTFSTPVAEYVDVPVLVGIEVREPEIPVCEEGTFTSPFICPDGSMIRLLKCVNGEWVDSGQRCPEVPEEPLVVPPTVGRAMVMAVPNTVPEGRTVEIVVQALCAGVDSDGEDATLLVDDVAVMTRPTKAGEVTFRWTAAEIGTRVVCVSIPANPQCPYPGAVCRSIKVVTYLPEVKEQVELERSEYETELAKLRKIRELERERLRGVAVSPGTVRIPPSLAGSTVVIGGIPRVVPPEGISITVPAGEEIITIIREGVEERVPVLIMPGETEKLPWRS